MREHFERAVRLYDLKKWESALHEFQGHLAEHPDDSQALSLAAFCELRLKRYGDATQTAARAIQADPLDSHTHYVMSIIMRERNAIPKAFVAIREALSLEPFYAHYLTELANLHIHVREWAEALDAADQALECEPEDLSALNARATALIRLRRTDDAELTLQDALRKDPEDEHTLANLGWLELERSRWNHALEHFKHALSLDPESEWARDGLMHALRAKFPVYGLVLRWFFFLSKYSEAIQRQILLAMYLGRQLIDYLLKKYPALVAIVAPLMVVWQIFSYLTWTIRAATTLFLRCSEYGRMLVNKDELLESNIVGVSWVLAITTWAYSYFVDPFADFSRIAPYVFWSLPMLHSIYFECSQGYPKKIALAVSGVLTVASLLGLLGIVLDFLWGWQLLIFYFRALGPVLLLSQFLIDKEPEKK